MGSKSSISLHNILVILTGAVIRDRVAGVLKDISNSRVSTLGMMYSVSCCTRSIGGWNCGAIIIVRLFKFGLYFFKA